MMSEEADEVLDATRADMPDHEPGMTATDGGDEAGVAPPTGHDGGAAAATDEGEYDAAAYEAFVKNAMITDDDAGAPLSPDNEDDDGVPNAESPTSVSRSLHHHMHVEGVVLLSPL
jgi:hypothetical protein